MEGKTQRSTRGDDANTSTRPCLSQHCAAGKHRLCICHFTRRWWFSALCRANHISPRKLLARAGGRESGEKGDGDAADEQIETAVGRKEEADVKRRENDRGRTGRLEHAVISQVLLWFITQTHYRDMLLWGT